MALQYFTILVWLVVDYLPLWKMMEWVTVGMMTFPTEWKKIMFQTTNQWIICHNIWCVFYVCFMSKYVVTNWICILILYNLYVCLDKLAYID